MSRCGPAPLRMGIDEAGRGPLAGPVCAGAVILPADAQAWGLSDSKRLTAPWRAALAERVQAESLAWGIGWASVSEIDGLNILRATCLAMQRAVEACLSRLQDEDAELCLWVDGNQRPDRYLPPGSWPWSTQTLVKGDQIMMEISAASILAKVARDQEMQRLAGIYPVYGFDRHSGYGTAAHLQAIDRHGPSPAHRRSFAPIRARCP